MATEQLSRRGLLRTGGVLAGTAGLGLLQGCAGAGGIDPALDELVSGNGGPNRGGFLRYGLSTDPVNFEPHVSSGAASDVIRQMTYNALLQYGDDGEIVGDLAAEHGWLDGVTYEVVIHPEVYFHDGTRLTVEDVVFSIERIVDPDTASNAASLFSGLDRVTKADERTVLFHLESPNVAFPFALAAPTANIVSRRWIESGANPLLDVMGTGPFRFVERIPGVSITLERHDDYFVPELPYLNGIQFSPMEDDYARVTALRTATVDIIDYIPATHVGVIENNPQLQIHSDSVFGFGFVGFVNSQPPFNDPDVRRAIALSLDRESILETAFLGSGEVMDGGFMPAAIAPYATELAGSVPYDPEQAQHLLKKSGNEGLPLDLITTSSYSVISRPAEAALPGIRRSGVDVTLHRQEWLSFQESVAAQTFPAFSWGTFMTLGDPAALRDLLRTGSRWATFMDFSDEEIDRLLAEGQTVSDPSLRNEIYLDVERRALELMPWTYSVRRIQAEATRSYVRGFAHPPKGGQTQVSLRKVWLEEEA